MANKVWVVDDDESIRWVLEKALTREQFEVRVFAAAADLLSALNHQQPHAVLSDIRMPGMDGVEMLKALKLRFPSLPVIIMTAHSDLESAVSAFQGGAFEYLAKPFDLPAAVELIRRACVQGQSQSAEPVVSERAEILGAAPAMQEVFRAIGRLSQSAVTVLITGESGSGKELVALALHKHSARAALPFVALNTAAIPRDLLESELFGHEKGAFTGAQQTRQGRFEQAEGGTLFLDEIGDMPSELQTRLLRVLSDGNFYRVGGQHPIKANARVIAATHQDLEQRVRQGLFREDLFHRLNVIRLRVPPLRERLEDVPMLVAQFLQRAAKELSVDAKRLSGRALEVLSEYHWPGNVRQLENVCRWLTVMAPAALIETKDLPPELTVTNTQISVATVVPDLSSMALPVPVSGKAAVNGLELDKSAASWEELLERQVAQLVSQQMLAGDAPENSDLMDLLSNRFEAAVISTTLRHTRGRRIEAALRLGIGRNTITRKIQELGLKE
jgi:two-component system, NtrC family, nitrogen regulation response regulator GlnG